MGWHGQETVPQRSTVRRPCHNEGRHGQETVQQRGDRATTSLSTWWGGLWTSPLQRPKVSRSDETFGQWGGTVRRPCHNEGSGDRATTRGQETVPQRGVRRPCHNEGSGDRATTRG